MKNSGIKRRFPTSGDENLENLPTKLTCTPGERLRQGSQPSPGSVRADPPPEHSPIKRSQLSGSNITHSFRAWHLQLSVGLQLIPTCDQFDEHGPQLSIRGGSKKVSDFGGHIVRADVLALGSLQQGKDLDGSFEGFQLVRFHGLILNKKEHRRSACCRPDRAPPETHANDAPMPNGKEAPNYARLLVRNSVGSQQSATKVQYTTGFPTTVFCGWEPLARLSYNVSGWISVFPEIKAVLPRSSGNSRPSDLNGTAEGDGVNPNVSQV